MLAWIAFALVLPFQIPGGWWTCPYGYWIRDGFCVPWHEGQDVDFGDDWSPPGAYDYWGLVEQQRNERLEREKNSARVN